MGEERRHRKSDSAPAKQGDFVNFVTRFVVPSTKAIYSSEATRLFGLDTVRAVIDLVSFVFREWTRVQS